jgi:hypothetical protein
MATASDNELKSLCVNHFKLRGLLDDVSVKIRKILIEKGIKTRDACQSIESELKTIGRPRGHTNILFFLPPS